jgi:hypothetical protein
MNLVKIQDELKGFPTQTIMAYVNGSNPEVPPYIALAELNRRKQMEQRKAEPPTQSVKEKLESEVTNPQGIAQLPQAMPPQGPPAAPQGMPPQMPQQMPQRPPGMAAGGITRLPTRSDMFHYAPGGIVAFAEGGELTPEDFGATRDPMGDINSRISYRTEVNPFPQRHGSIPSDVAYGDKTGSHNPALELPGALTSQNKGVQPSGVAALPETAQLQDLVPNAANQLRQALLGKLTVPEVQSKEDIRKALIADALADGNVEKAKMLSQIPGDSLVPLVKQLNKQNEEQRAGFKEGQGRMGLAALSNALIAAGEATRGRREPGFFAGTGDALGGFGKSYNSFTAEDVKRLEAQKAVERAQTIESATLQAKIDDLRAAHATGTVQDKQEAQKAVQEQALKMQTLQMGAADKILAQALEQAKAETTKSHYGAIEKQAQAALEETKAQHEAQRSQFSLSLAEQKAQHKLLAQDRAERLEEMRNTRPTVEDKAIGKILQVTPARVRSLEAKQKDLEFGSDEWNQIQDRIDDTYDQAYRAYGLTPPARLPKPTLAEPKEKPGFLSRIFGNNTPAAAAAPASNTLYATNPDTGERKMSNDGGQTWTTLGGRR